MNTITTIDARFTAVPAEQEEKPKDLPPEGIFKLLFTEDKHLFLLQEDIEKFPFFKLLASNNFTETNNRIIDFTKNELITLEIFILVRQLLHGKKKEVFEDPDRSLLEDPTFFDRVHDCFDFLYPEEKEHEMESFRNLLIERLHQRILRCLDVDLCIKIYNAFTDQHEELSQVGAGELLTLEYLRKAFEEANGFVIVQIAIDCLIVTKTFFKGNSDEADDFFCLFHELAGQISYLKSKHFGGIEKQMRMLAETFGKLNAKQIEEIDKELEADSKCMDRLVSQHREEDTEEVRGQFFDVERHHKRMKIEREFLCGESLIPIEKRHKKFYAISVAALKRQISKRCFPILLPKQALEVSEAKESTPLQRLIATNVLDRFQRCILKNSLNDFRLGFPYREDMVYWCTRLLAYYNFRIVDGHIQHPFQIAAVLDGSLRSEGYKTGFSYLFQGRTPEDLQTEIREDLKLCGMEEDALGPRMKDVPTFSNTFLELNRGTLLILKKVLKQTHSVEEIPGFEPVKTFVDLIQHYWDHIDQHYVNYRFSGFMNFMDYGKPWNLHAQSPVSLEQLFREKLSAGIRFYYNNPNDGFLLETVTDYDEELDANNLRCQRYGDPIMLPKPLYKE